MSILDKHPAPWREGDDGIVAADGSHVLSGGCVGMDNAEACIDDECKRLILAAPELLAVLKEMVDHGESVKLHLRAEALIALIEAASD